MATHKIVEVAAGLSQPSSTRLLADRLAAATLSKLAARGLDAEVQVIELRDFAHDVTSNLLTNFPSPALAGVVDAVTHADGLIAVTPVFTASYSGLFKSFFDVVDNTALEGKPVLLAATGGTERHSLVLEYQMRPMFAYLHATPTPTAVYAASTDWGGGMEQQRTLQDRIDRAAGELAELVAARPAAADRPAADLGSIPFEQLLAHG
jgi:FMN reductase